jgi:hypothetical protein
VRGHQAQFERCVRARILLHMHELPPTLPRRDENTADRHGIEHEPTLVIRAGENGVAEMPHMARYEFDLRERRAGFVGHTTAQFAGLRQNDANDGLDVVMPICVGNALGPAGRLRHQAPYVAFH